MFALFAACIIRVMRALFCMSASGTPVILLSSPWSGTNASRYSRRAIRRAVSSRGWRLQRPLLLGGATAPGCLSEIAGGAVMPCAHCSPVSTTCHHAALLIMILISTRRAVRRSKPLTPLGRHLVPGRLFTALRIDPTAIEGHPSHELPPVLAARADIGALHTHARLVATGGGCPAAFRFDPQNATRPRYSTALRVHRLLRSAVPREVQSCKSPDRPHSAISQTDITNILGFPPRVNVSLSAKDY